MFTNKYADAERFREKKPVTLETMLKFSEDCGLLF